MSFMEYSHFITLFRLAKIVRLDLLMQPRNGKNFPFKLKRQVPSITTWRNQLMDYCYILLVHSVCFMLQKEEESVLVL